VAGPLNWKMRVRSELVLHSLLTDSSLPKTRDEFDSEAQFQNSFRIAIRWSFTKPFPLQYSDKRDSPNLRLFARLTTYGTKIRFCTIQPSLVGEQETHVHLGVGQLG
jgi:hypothetical protein